MKQQLSMLDLMMPPPQLSPKAAAKAKAKLSPWEAEKLANRDARFQFRSGLPIEDDRLLTIAWDQLRSYDTSVNRADYDGMVVSANQLKAIGEHAFGLSEAEAENFRPPNGNERFTCLCDAWDWLMASLAAEDWKIPMFGQKGHLEIEVAGCRVDFEYAGMFGICGGNARVIDREKPFFSETGYRSFQVCPIDFVIAAPKLDCKAWLERICMDQLTEGGKKPVRLTRAWPTYALQWRQNREFAESVDRSDTWTQWGPEKHAEHWASHDARQKEALAQMQSDGIDPTEVWRTRK